MTLESLSTLVASYGYLIVFIAVLVANIGIPFPAGELLIAAAAYAAHTHRLSLPILLIGAGSIAIVGGFAAFAAGGSLGAATLARYGGAVGLGPARLRLGQYLFLTHGGKIVFFLRFVALISPFGGLLAGANRMPWRRFVVYNVLGGVAWAGTMTFGGFLFGAFFASVGRPVGMAALVLAGIGALGTILYIHRQGATLQAKADAMLLVDSSGVEREAAERGRAD